MTNTVNAAPAVDTEGLEVVAIVERESDYWTNGGFHGKSYFRKGSAPEIPQAAIKHLAIGTQLVRLSDATAVIDQLRERVAELEASPLMSPEEARAGIALQLKEIERLRTELAELKSAPVVMPERCRIEGCLSHEQIADIEGWNACLDEFERLNGGQNNE